MNLENCILIMALGPKTLSRARPWLPKSWKLRALAERCADFQRYMTELYEDEKARALAGGADGGARTLMSSLVRASQDAGEAVAGAGLSESEIYGNMFMLNFAGHETTAHTLTFAVHFLASHPEVQDWVSEEARLVLGGDGGDKGWDYAASFPRLVRCFAVLLETLRLYTPVPVAKWTAAGTARLDLGGRAYTVPPDKPNDMITKLGSTLDAVPACSMLSTFPKPEQVT